MQLFHSLKLWQLVTLLAMAEDYAPEMAEDGVQECRLRSARALLTRLIDDARDDGVTSALTNQGTRRVYLVPPKTYDVDRRNEALVQALERQEPELYARLLAELH
jgi:PHD/YefM family antitoxin component YafN of YafNO toxin-antitoxin module